MLKTILVPLDGSGLAERALSVATALSISTAAHLVLLHVSADPTPDAYIEKTGADLCDRGFHVETVTSHHGKVAQAILEVAEAQNADLIVMTTHGRTGLARWVLGSVAETVVNCSPVPVMLERAWDPGRRALLLDDQPRVLVPVDGSRLAECALPTAVELADDLGGELLLVEVKTEPRHALTVHDDLTRAPSGEAYAATAVREYLDLLADRLRRESPTLAVRTREEWGDPAIAIVEATDESRSAFVVMATHGRTGFRRTALGSVADRVLHHGRAPLVLVRPTLEAASQN